MRIIIRARPRPADCFLVPAGSGKKCPLVNNTKQMDNITLEPELNWYALRVFKNRLHLVKAQAEGAGFDTYQAVKTVASSGTGQTKGKEVPLIPTLLFIKSTPAFIEDLRRERFDHTLVYGDKPGGKPAPIDNAQMETFILVTSPKGGCEVEYIPDGAEQFRKGDPVRVTEGFYKGATGVVRRIKKDRKLLVAVEGVAIVAISNIPVQFLEKLSTEN